MSAQDCGGAARRIRRCHSQPTFFETGNVKAGEGGNFTQLTPDEAQGIFENSIKPDLFAGSSRVEKPSFVLLAGQPGAGKSSALDLARQRFGTEGCVNVSNDALMTYHPNYYELTTKGYDAPFSHPAMMEVYGFASAMRVAVLDAAVAEGRNVVFEHTLPRDSAERQLPKMLGERFKTVDLWVLATPGTISRLSTYVRYEKQRAALAAAPDGFKNTHQDGPRKQTDAGNRERFALYRNCISELHALKLADQIRRAVILDRNGIHFESENFKSNSAAFRQMFVNLVDREITPREYRSLFDALPDLGGSYQAR
ncbi:zeta toxin family protein [Martelella alba]|uniref:zeta toxin family protein n=1 Tax=Martelella alba TaxID=2590451 RepID=UPI0015E86829|nr:zeta toxin family protein [Martelella alba]